MNNIKVELNIKMRPIPNFGELFTMKEFDELLECGAVTPDDGDGYYATEKEMSDISIFTSPFKEEFKKIFSHVIWFNK